MTILLALCLAGADARLETAGVRFGDVLHSSPVLELHAGALVSGNVVEPLGAAVRLDVGGGLTLVLEPGVRATREVDGLRLSAHAPARLRMSTSFETWESVRLTRGESGWRLGEKALAGEIAVALQAQDDPDAALRAMQESARKMRESSQRVRLPMQRRVFSGGNPFTGSEPAGSQSIRQQLNELSLTGS